MKPKNIVVVDDNKNDLLMAKYVIQRMGYNPVLLENASQLIPTLKTMPVAVIVLDYEMPDFSGLDLLKKIKKIPSLSVIPIVMLTGNSSPSHVKDTILQGAVDYIVKPIDPTIFENKINKILKNDISANKQSWIEYQLNRSKNHEVKIYNFCEIVSIGEVSLTLRTKQDYPVGFTFFSDSPLFTELEIKNPALKVESSVINEGYYLVQCSLLGLSETELKKIRLYQKLLSPSRTA